MKPLFLIGAVCLAWSLSAYNSNTEILPESSARPSRPEELVSAQTDTLDLAENHGLPYGRPVNFDRGGLPAGFADAIETYCHDGTFPDGQGGGEIPGSIFYTAYDVDGDGNDELMIQNSSTVTAGMTERIYSCEDGVFREEFSEYPALTYYDNGIILAAWSHNQGLAGDELWPYTLYQYQPETDSYEVLGYVDAWSRERADFTNEWGEFPDEIDNDGDGCVYFLLPSDWEGQYSHARIVDGPDHENWRDQYLNGGGILEIPYQELKIETVFPNAAG